MSGGAAMLRLPILYLLRHGETEDNVARVISSQSDSPLTARGRALASANGRLLAEIVPDTRAVDFFASPLGRAQTTMQLVRANAGLTPEGYSTDPRLMESDFGEWTRKSIADAFAFRAADVAATGGHERTWRWPGGESRADVEERVHRFLRELRRDAVIVGHAGSITTIRGLALGMTSDKMWARGLGDVGIIRLQDSTEARFGA
jgi:broad specificity phosphatase PhoE